MYYDTVEEAIKAAPNCTHVLTTGSKWKGRKSLAGKFAPVIYTDAAYLCATDTSAHYGANISEYSWVVAVDLSDPSQSQTICELLDEARSKVTAARFDTAATDRQIGGDHYKSLKIQPIEYIDANNLPYLEGNVIKYVTRHASKNGVQDIDKAIHYLELIKQMRYAEDNTSDR